MHLLGQVDQVRLLGPHGICGPPLHLHRRKSSLGLLTPFKHVEWHRLKSGAWIPIPDIWGGAGIAASLQEPRAVFGTTSAVSSTQSTQALSSAYTYNSAGNVGGGRVRFIFSKTINNIYFFITAFTGTAANVNDIDVELRNDTSNKPGSTTHIITTVNPSSATGWINTSGLSFAASSDTSYWVSIADADGNATDFATILLRSLLLNTITDFSDKTAGDSTNGWSTTTLRSDSLSMVVTFSDGTSFGNPFTATANATSTTNRRGLLLNSLTEQLKIFGMAVGNGSANFSGLELWSGTNGPSGTPDASGVVEMLNSASVPIGFAFATPPTLAKATQYRIVLTSSSANTSPRKMQIGTGVDANLRAAMLGGGSWYWTESSGTTDWSNDDTNSWPQAALMIEDQLVVATSGNKGDGSGIFRHMNLI